MKTIRTYIIIVLTMLFIKPADVMAQSSTPGFAPDGVVLNKNVVPGSQPNTYTINLEAFVTGSTITTVEEQKEPIDFGLILDMSGSMEEFVGFNYTLVGKNRFKVSELTGGYTSWTDFTSACKNLDIVSRNIYVDGESCDCYPTAYAYFDGTTYKHVGIANKGGGDYVLFYIDWDASSATATELSSSGGFSGLKTSEITLYKANTFGSKLYLLKQAASNFVNVVSKDAKENKLDHTISIIRYNNEGYVENDRSIEEYTGSEYEKAAVIKQFKLLNESGTTNADALKAAINKLKTSGSTYPQYGVDLLNDLYDEQTLAGKLIKDNGHKKIVVLFSDGEPGSSGFQQDNANSTIRKLCALKSTYKATVFTVGIFKNVNNNCHAYMNASSSNYPNALAYTDANVGGALDINAHDYYRLAGDENLYDIFERIATESVSGGANYGLTKESTTVIDVVSPAFKLPDGASGSTITLQVAKCKAVKPTDTSGSFEYTFEEPVSATSLFPDIKAKVGNLDGDKQFVEAEGGKTVQVLGFDFSENYVGEDIDDGGKTPRGYKLIISFPIEIDPRNPGGANVATNTEDSGIYFDEDGDGKYDQIGGFAIPHAKIPNLVIMKTGLHKDESATFYVYKLEKDGSKSQFPIVLVVTQTSDDPSTPCYARAKIQEPGRYEVEESTWSWAYYISARVKDYAVDDKDKGSTPVSTWNELGYGDKGAGYQAEIPWTFGTQVPEGTRSIIRNVNDFTEDPTQKGTLFSFTNKDKEKTPAHGEASKNNVFYESR